jgi:hypothetical protein
MNAIYAACLAAAVASLGDMPDDRLRGALCDATKAIMTASEAGDLERKGACYDAATKLLVELKQRGLALGNCVQ